MGSARQVVSYQGPRELAGGTRKVNKDFSSESSHVTAICAIGFFTSDHTQKPWDALCGYTAVNVRYSVCTLGLSA
jgi:hypothetical protein